MGRNDPCACGSGKKYKRCHLPLVQRLEPHLVRSKGFRSYPVAHDTLVERACALTTERLDAMLHKTEEPNVPAK